jgi:hypothetical protein
MKKDKSKERTQRYRERLTEKHEAAAEQAYDRAQCAKFDLRFFGESAHNRNAESSSEEIHIHRQFLRALGQPDVQQESLRQLAQRTWNSYIGISDDVGGEWVDGKWIESDDRWVPLFNPGNQTFDGGPRWQGYIVPGGVRYFEYWVPPVDCQNGEADQPIDINLLPPLPPAPTRKLEVKPERKVELPSIEQPTPLESSVLGSFGVTRTSHL